MTSEMQTTDKVFDLIQHTVELDFDEILEFDMSPYCPLGGSYDESWVDFVSLEDILVGYAKDVLKTGYRLGEVKVPDTDPVYYKIFLLDDGLIAVVFAWLS